jgi:hypothetical protein
MKYDSKSRQRREKERACRRKKRQRARWITDHRLMVGKTIIAAAGIAITAIPYAVG